MKLRSTRFGAVAAVLAIGLGGLLASQTSPHVSKPPPPKFKTFGVSPHTVCANLGLPLVRIDWTVSGSGSSCVSLSANGQVIMNGVQQPWFPNGVTRCGDNSWTGTATVSLRDVYGNNIPPTIRFDATLEGPFVLGASPEQFDTASDQIEVKVDCTAGVHTGG
ncbi:MAG: hypothetical protein IPJ41_17125 [Phycisphaerales bacterium]|nr:hypothetical protein [Phycisphaerales bacterium]